MHSPFVGAYWKSRKETKSQCAVRGAAMFARILVHPGLSQWFLKGKTAKAALNNPLQINPEELERLLKTNNRDDNGEAITELGFRLNVWNGSSSEAATLSITCGAFSPSVRNAVVLTLPSVYEVQEGTMAIFRDLLTTFVEVWEPESAVVTSSQLISQEGGGMPWESKGWYNYIKGSKITAGKK